MVAAARQEVQEGLVVERAEQPEPQVGLIVERVEQPELQAAAPTQLNPPVDKAVRAEILRPNLPAARARIASIPQGLELGRGAPVVALAGRAARVVQAGSDRLTRRERVAAPTPYQPARPTTSSPATRLWVGLCCPRRSRLRPGCGRLPTVSTRTARPPTATSQTARPRCRLARSWNRGKESS